MSGSGTLGLEQAVLGHTLAFAPMVAPVQVYVALDLAPPAVPPSEAAPGTEAVGVGYARMPATFALIATPANIAANTATIEFPAAGSAWGTIGYFELWDAPIGGNRLYWGPLIDPATELPTTITVGSGDIVRFSPGALAVQAATGSGGTSSVGAYLPLAGGTLTGPLLLAADPTTYLQAATKQYVDAHSGTGGGPGFLPLSGGTMLGQLTLAGNATNPLHAVPLQQVPPGVVVPPGGSIQAAHDALPATGGTILLAANTTYVLTAMLNITKPNVVIQAPSWNTVIQRGAAFTSGHLISGATTATGFVLRGVTVDGNSVVVSGGFDGNTNGADSLIQQCQFINNGGNGCIGLAGVGSRADSNRIIGLSSPTVGGYGIWAIDHQKVSITNNHITGTTIDAIGFDGQGSQVIGNYVANCQCSASPGGQIVQYSPGLYPGALIEGNMIDQGGGINSSGIELNGFSVSVIGNTIINQYNCGIAIDSGTGASILISGNTILNNSQHPGQVGGIAVFAPLNSLTIVGNRIGDTQATPTQAWGIWINGTATNVLIADNDLTGNVTGAIYGGATGYVMMHNLGAPDSPGVPAVNAANDAAASGAGVPVGGTYRNGSAIMVRVA
jgi:hypothetical protein